MLCGHDPRQGAALSHLRRTADALWTHLRQPSLPLRGEIPGEYVEQSGRNFLSEPDDAAGRWQSPRPGGMSADRPGVYGGHGAGGYQRPAQGARPAYGGVRSAPAPRPGTPAARPRPDAGALPAFQKGDTVIHKAFGKGMVTSVQPMGATPSSRSRSTPWAPNGLCSSRPGSICPRRKQTGGPPAGGPPVQKRPHQSSSVKLRI